MHGFAGAKKALIFVHRWMGVALSALFLLWFSSGIVMMYSDFPSVRPADRLKRSRALDVSQIRLSPTEALPDLRMLQPASQIRLNLFDGRPVYRFRTGRNDKIVYADTGEEQTTVDSAMAARIASAWTGQPAAEAKVESLQDVDQWTVEGPLCNIRPLWKYSWSNGEQVYLSGLTGEVVQYTTRQSRFWAYVGPIPHWLYFTALRKHQPQWSRLVIGTSGAGTIVAILGMTIGIWMYSPSKRRRRGPSASSIPYRGQKRWHMIFGLVFGLGAVTWAFSGMLSMDPFPARRGGALRAARPADIESVLRGRIFQLGDFQSKSPREALLQLPDLKVKELELALIANEPVYVATMAGGDTRIVPVNGGPLREVGAERVIETIKRSVGEDMISELRTMDDYDAYYSDRNHHLPLPVIFLRLNDADRSRYYIDPKTARVVGSYSSRSWMNRWLYHGLHSLDFPWFYKRRPLWDIIVIAFMAGGTALCVTSLVLAWRVLKRHAIRLFQE